MIFNYHKTADTAFLVLGMELLDFGILQKESLVEDLLVILRMSLHVLSLLIIDKLQVEEEISI